METVAFLTLASDPPFPIGRSLNHFSEVSPFPTEVLNLVSPKA